MAAGRIAGNMALVTCTGAGRVEAFAFSGDGQSVDAEATPRVTFEHLGPGLLRVNLQRHSNVTEADGELARAWVLAQANGNPVRVLLDVTGVGSVSREAVTFYSEATHVAAFALLGSTAVDKVIAHGLRGLAWPGCPVRYFVDEGEALAWLEGYR